jgi:alpha-methylacyl-CoA racemase
MLVKVPKPDGSEQQQVGSPFPFSHGRATYKHTGVELGTHSNEVLAEIGYKSSEIEAFHDGGLLG